MQKNLLFSKIVHTVIFNITRKNYFVKSFGENLQFPWFFCEDLNYFIYLCGMRKYIFSRSFQMEGDHGETGNLSLNFSRT
jgi:hypothetical protein